MAKVLKYAPELNAIERDWLANQLFGSFEQLERRIHWSVAQMNAARLAKTLQKLNESA